MHEDRSEPASRTIALDGADSLTLLGQRDQNLRAIEKTFDVSVVVRNGTLRVFGHGDSLDRAERFIVGLLERVRSGRPLSETDFQDFLTGRRDVGGAPDADDDLVLHFDRKVVKPRTSMQAEYLRRIASNDIVFGIGPAGTGKTYLAVAMAVSALKARQVDRLVLARPAVEAGEKLGYLPGDLQEKIDPYLRPLYDALEDVITYERLQKLLTTNVIEIVPLAFMRGRTLARSFVILDEAQNSTLRQMKMFLTRLGLGSRAVVTGDVTQVDLPVRSDSGLIQIEPILSEVDGVSFVHFTDVDVVRHQLVKDIIRAFDTAAADGVAGDEP